MNPSAVRPTLRVLKELNLSLPDARTSLSEINHPIVAKAQAIPLQVAAHGAEPFRAIKDNRWWKVKAQRWRGAVVNVEDESWWLGMAGYRQDGSPEDFYAEHESAYKHDGSSHAWLPQADDFKRKAIEFTVDTRVGALAREVVPGASADDWEVEPTKDGFGIMPGRGQLLYRAFVNTGDLQILLEKHSDVGLQ